MLNAPPYFLIFILYFSSPKQNLVHSLPNLHDHTQPPPNTMLHPNTTSCFNIVPNPNHYLSKLHWLKSTVKCLMLFNHDWHASGTILHKAKDIA